MVAMTAIDRTSAGHRRHAAAGGSWSAALAAATLAVGISGRLTVPVALIATLAARCAAHWSFRCARDRACRRRMHAVTHSAFATPATQCAMHASDRA